MLVTANTEEILEQMKQLQIEFRRKLEHTVARFTARVVFSAAEHTPLGDPSGVLSPATPSYRRLYEQRQQEMGLSPIEGNARGSWQAAMGSLTVRQLLGRDTDLEAHNLAYQYMISNYKLGQEFSIGNSAYYIQALENNSSFQTGEQGIVEPLMADILTIYSTDFKKLYETS